jgi:hypothetical protein
VTGQRTRARRATGTSRTGGRYGISAAHLSTAPHGAGSGRPRQLAVGALHVRSRRCIPLMFFRVFPPPRACNRARRP